jgi:hypothetical protein
MLQPTSRRLLVEQWEVPKVVRVERNRWLLSMEEMCTLLMLKWAPKVVKLGRGKWLMNMEGMLLQDIPRWDQRVVRLNEHVDVK